MIPFLRYHDAKSAIAFLEEGFGFESKLVVEDEDGKVAHAQLSFGTGMVMLSEVQEGGEHAEHITTAREAGKPTAGVYIVVDDVDSHATRAAAAGADVFYPPAAQDYGGRAYTCLDPEGNMWSFGSYDPLPGAEEETT
jgi:uncharacterized glyoxalase superfamily protein PhnB